MKIGHSRCLLTPNKEFYLIGYRSENRLYPASGVHDDIYANALLFNDGKQQLFIFNADYLEFEEEMAEKVKTLMSNKYGLNRDLILLSATHNHSSVVSYHKGWYTGKFDQEYYEFLLHSICNCYEECLNNEQEATAHYGKKILTGYYGNRNHPGKLADNEVIVVKFLDKNKNAFAGFINWAVHSTVISANNTYLTAELAGTTSNKLYKEFGFYPAMIVGAAGDCSNRNERQGNDFEELERVSSLICKDIANIEVNHEVILDKISVQTLFHTIDHDMGYVHDEILTEIKKMEKEIQISNDKNRKEFLTKKINNVKKELDIHHFHLDAKASVIQLGQMQFFVFPGELGSAFGIEMKHNYSYLGIICGYTNGYYEYFMPSSEYGLSFETIGCKVPRGEPEKLIQKFIQASKLLNEDKTYEK